MKSRSIKLTIEYKPYTMGSKFFLIVKIIEIHSHSQGEELMPSRLEVGSEDGRMAYFNSSIGNKAKTSHIL